MQTLKLGFLIKTLGTSQQGLLMTSNLNALLSIRHDLEVTVFYEDYDRFPIETKFALMQNRQAWGYKGILISTDIECTHLLATLPGPCKKFFYTWNLEWLYEPMSLEYCMRAYQDDDIDLIARSRSHSTLLTRLWKEPKHIIEDFDYDELAKITDRYGKKV
jgi:hypothetical protein